MLPINQNLTSINYNTGYGKSNNYIVIHYTANNGDTAWGNTNYFKSVNRGASANYFVDETSIWQCVRDSDISWHVGASTYYNGARNTNSIGIELCSRRNGSNVNDLQSYYFDDRTVKNAAELTAYLQKKYGIPDSNIVRHYDVTRKVCPAPFVYDTAAWQDFLRMVKGGEEDMTKAETEALFRSMMTEANIKQAFDANWAATMKQYENGKPASWAVKEIADVKAKGYMDGTRPQSFMSRQEAAVMASRMTKTYKTVDELPRWYKEAIQYWVDEGVLQGNTEATIDINDAEARCLVWLYRALADNTEDEQIEGQTVLPEV